MKYVIAIGSNIKPNRHVPWVLQRMIDEFEALVVGKFFRTNAYGMYSAQSFWNGAVVVETTLEPTTLKTMLCGWEIESGRNRSHPQCSVRRRTLDLDLIWSKELGWFEDLSALKKLPYIWCPVAPLLAITLDRKPPLRPKGFKLGKVLLGFRQVNLKKTKFDVSIGSKD